MVLVLLLIRLRIVLEGHEPAIQVLQGPYVTNTYGGGVSCQGTTLNMTPYIQFADSRKDPWEDFYNEPQYNTTDATGKMVPTTMLPSRTILGKNGMMIEHTQMIMVMK